MRHVLAALATTFVVVSVALMPTGAAHAEPTNGCGQGFYLLGVLPGGEAVDRNGDGWICGKDIPQSPFGGIIIDNRARL